MVTSPAVRIGVDVGGTKSHAVAVDDEGRVVVELRRPSGFGAEQVLGNLTSTVADLAARLEQAGSMLHSIGVGIPVQVDQRTQRVSSAVNLGLHELTRARSCWLGVGVPVHLDNGVNVAALGASVRHAPSATSLWDRFIGGVARAVQLLCSTYDPRRSSSGAGSARSASPFVEHWPTGSADQ